MKLNLTKPIVVFVLLLSFTSLARAGTHEFEIVNVVFDRSIFMPGEVGKAYITINNTGDSNEYLYVQYSYDGKVYKLDNLVYVSKGTSKQFVIFFIAPSTGGMFNVTFKIYNIFGSSEFNKVVIVNPKSYEFELRLDKESWTIAKGLEADFYLTIYNLGNSRDKYAIKVENWEDYKIEKNLISLYSLKEETIQIKFFTDNTSAGEYPIKIEVCSLNTFECKEKEITLKILKPEVEQTQVNLSEEESVNPLGNLSIEMLVKNVGFGEKDYSIEIETDLNHSISPTTFTLSPNEEKIIQLNFTEIPAGVHLVNYTIYANEIPVREGSIKINALAPGFTIYAIFMPTPSLILGIVAIIIIVALIVYFWRKRSFLEEEEELS